MTELPYFPFTPFDDQPRVGLKNLELTNWIEIDENWERHVRMKKDIVQSNRDLVLRVLPGAEEACLELRDVLALHLATTFPRKFSLQDRKLLTPLGLSYAPPAQAEEALEQISEWTQEDWAIMSAKPPVRLDAGLICFPSRWSLAEKIGLDSDGIHGPVPRYASIAKPTQSFLERISTDKPMWRMNWTIHDSDRLFCPTPHPPAEGLTEENVLEKTWLRIERQTLRRLPQTGAVVFSIRTYLHLMSDVVSTDERREQAKESIMALSPESAAYKGMRNFYQLLVTRLG